jgi:AraC-like DNA-binding protein
MIGSKAFHQAFLPDGRERAYVWKYSQPIGGRRPRHFHGEPELNLVLQGAAVFGVGDRTARVTQGELLSFPAGQDHELLEASSDLYVYAIGLEPAYSAEVLGSALEPIPFHVRLEERDFASIVDRAAALVDRSVPEQAGAELWERAHFLGRRALRRAERTTHVLTRRALQRLGSAPELGLEKVANEVGAHPSEISRHFHRDVGMTLVRYRTRLRLLHFIRLVDAGQHDLSMIASAVGFGSYSQCHRAFHAELGCGPRQFCFEGLREEMQLAYAP